MPLPLLLLLLSNPKDQSIGDGVFHFLGPIYGPKTFLTLDRYTSGWNGNLLESPHVHRS